MRSASQGANPIISFEEPIFDVLTTSSVLTVSVGANDSDGTIEGVQFYIDGAKFGDLIFRTPGLIQTSQSYSADLSFSEAGVKSILAVAHDNGGNYVASQTHTLSIAPGSIPAVIEFGSGISDFTFNQGTVDLNISSSGTILGINLPQALGNNFVGSPRVDILGDGTGAEATATVNQTVGSAEYGKITSIQIQNGGIGYDINSTNLKIVPVVRLVGNGTPAEIANPILTDFNETTGNEDFVSQTVLLDTNVDGSSRGVAMSLLPE